jgi:isopentenyldiphosphate isomerase
MVLIKGNYMELYDILDDSGAVIGKAGRDEIHRGDKLLHGVVHLLVFNDQGQLLLQKRSPAKIIEPGKWDTSVGGHIDAGETVEQALPRETEEELGIRNPLCERLYSSIMETDIERELVATFRCIWNGPIAFNPEEISEVAWFTPEEVESMLGAGVLTPNFEQEWDNYLRWKRAKKRVRK